MAEDEKAEAKLPENPTEYETTLIKAWRQDGYSDEQIVEFLEQI